MGVREEPQIRESCNIRIYHDWRHDDYTKCTNTINYCSFVTDNIPQKPGVYFLYSYNELFYVGMSSNLRKRINQHISVNKHITNKLEPSEIDRKLHVINRVEFELYPEEDLPWIEMFYICKLKPSINSETWKTAFK